MQERRAARRITEPISNLLEENARDARNRAEASAANGLNGIRGVQLKLVSAAQENVNALFEYVQDVCFRLSLWRNSLRRQRPTHADRSK